MRRVLLAAVVLGTLPAAISASAQVDGGSWGLGGQLGDPDGITLKFYTSRPVMRGGATFNAYDLLFGWDFDDYFFASAHALHERRLQDTPLNFFLGPGLFLFFDDDRGPGDDDDVGFGISGQFGLNYFVERLEIFLHLTPRLRLVDSTDGDLGGGIGLRYYF